MLPKAIAQIIVAGTQVVGRAFARALRQEFQHAGQAASKQSGSGAGKEGKQQARRATADNIRHGISLQEAHQILNVKDIAKPDEILERYNHLFTINDKTKGGSFYIQSKVYQARKRIEAELETKGIKLEDPPEKTEKSESSTEDTSQESKKS